MGERVELPFGNGAAVPCLGARVEVVKNLAGSDFKVCRAGLLSWGEHNTNLSNWLYQPDKCTMGLKGSRLWVPGVDSTADIPVLLWEMRSHQSNPLVEGGIIPTVLTSDS